MKRYALLLAVLLTSTILAQAQDEEEEENKGGWKKDHLFIGSGVNLGFSNGFIIGLNPEVGYSINNIIDAGIAVNFNYITQRSPVVNQSIRYLALGAGPFVRIWPVRMIFLGSQFEYNRLSVSEKVNGTVTARATANAPSLLAGIGYGNRIIGQSQFFTSIYIDLLKDINSPYRDQLGRVQPVFRTGFIIYFGAKRNRDY
jgi:hypothetical protein